MLSGMGDKKPIHMVDCEAYVHSMDALVDVDGILSCHHLVDGRTALLFLSFLGRCHLNRKQDNLSTSVAENFFQTRLPPFR